VFYPSHIGFLQKLLLASQNILTKGKGHIPEGWCVFLEMIVEKVKQRCPVRTLGGELAWGDFKNLGSSVLMVLLILIQDGVLKRLLWLLD